MTTYINIIVIILGLTCLLKVSTKSQVMYLGAFSKVHSLKIQKCRYNPTFQVHRTHYVLCRNSALITAPNMIMEWQTVANTNKTNFQLLRIRNSQQTTPPITTHSKYSAVHVTIFFLLLIPHETK